MKKKYIQYIVFIILVCAAAYIIPAKISMMLNNKGFVAYNETDYPQAISLYEKAIRIHPAAKTYFNLGCAYEKMGRDDQIIAAFKKALDLDLGYQPACKALASIYAVKGDYRQAKQYLDSLELLGAQDTDKAGRDLKKFRIVNLYNQGVKLYAMRQGEKALNNFKQVIELDASNFLAYKAAADIYSRQGKPSLALRYYKQAVSLGLKDADAFNSMGMMCMRQEDYISGVRYFRKALKMDKGNLYYLSNLAGTLRDSGQAREALSLYNKVVEISACYPNVHNDIAGIYANMELMSKAQSEYQKEREIVFALMNRGMADDLTLTRMAIACNGLNENAKAEKILDEVIARNSNYYRAYYARGDVYSNQGKKTKSNADYCKARELARNIVTAKEAEYFPENDLEQEMPKQKTHGETAVELCKDTDIIYLHNGHILRGRILKKTDKTITLQMQTGRTLGTITFQNSKIKKIQKID